MNECEFRTGEKIDETCARALAKITSKYIAGMKEHGGVGLAKSGMSMLDLVKNIQEEAIDTVMYCEAYIMESEKE